MSIALGGHGAQVLSMPLTWGVEISRVCCLQALCRHQARGQRQNQLERAHDYLRAEHWGGCLEEPENEEGCLDEEEHLGEEGYSGEGYSGEGCWEGLAEDWRGEEEGWWGELEEGRED